ncbi:MAG: SulP family inorganic anion transporter, partial [Microbacterium sp.]
MSTVAVVALQLDEQGVSVLGEVPPGPPTLSWPIIEWGTWLLLVPSAIALTMITTAEGLLVSRAYGEKRGYPTKPNRDLLAFGLGNIAAGASASFAMGSSTSRTASIQVRVRDRRGVLPRDTARRLDRGHPRPHSFWPSSTLRGGRPTPRSTYSP